MALPVCNLQALLFWSFKEVGGRRRKINYIPQICHLQDRVKQVYHQQVVMLVTKGKMDNYQSYTCTHILIVEFLYSFTFLCFVLLQAYAKISRKHFCQEFTLNPPRYQSETKHLRDLKMAPDRV